ncbi:mediator of RNA polymerase II transcription subunit 26-like isoform X2 [Pollicipes pollicipes]|uniref:mediator of RNA polymerase II transcription subunit 26-like isoform X2 n=1 Tax=Pollicipes pollicipes TaxID=41117 RepID=UPI001884BB3D|nr:mediator of RNA polymerase II transcription subunit 26-like isoform X2 [Pollicipes pollicipes]XP_037093006.1 mediator of RNA polymerase II transcription subunit 26-like isoform X2 [Pollicipes pollicipes]
MKVIDMAVVLDVISILEQLPISLEALEATRLGKHINELRKKTEDTSLKKRAKALVRRWRGMMVIPQPEPAPVAPTAVRRSSPSGASPRSYPSSANTSPCLSRSTTPGLSKLSPGLVRNVTLQPISPALGSWPRPPAAAPAHQAAYSPPPAQTLDKTDVANKRKRKAEPAGGERSDKRPCFNGVQDECSRDSISGEINSEVPPALKAAPAKKPRRSRSAAAEVASFDDLTEKLASVARTPRVKTTRQLLSDLAERSGDSALARRASQFPAAQPPPPPPRREPPHDLTRNKSAHMQKFLNWQGGKRRPAQPIETIDLEEVEAAEEVGAGEPPAEPPRPWPTEEEILARLPPLDESAIVWSDDEPEGDGEPAARTAIDPAHLDAGHRLENINGNTNHEGEFREWHQVVTASTCDGGVLSMLPYVIID